MSMLPAKRAREILADLVRDIVTKGNCLKRWLLYLLKEGNNYERRFAWRILHPFQPKKINAKRAMIAQRKIHTFNFSAIL